MSGREPGCEGGDLVVGRCVTLNGMSMTGKTIKTRNRIHLKLKPRWRDLSITGLVLERAMMVSAATQHS